MKRLKNLRWIVVRRTTSFEKCCRIEKSPSGEDNSPRSERTSWGCVWNCFYNFLSCRRWLSTKSSCWREKHTVMCLKNAWNFQSGKNVAVYSVLMRCHIMITLSLTQRVKQLNRFTTLWLESLRHPTYSFDIAPCNYNVFVLLKEALSVKKFSGNEEIKEAVHVWLQGQ